MIDKFKQIKKLSENLDQELEELKIEVEKKQLDYREKISSISNITEITEGLSEEEFKNFVKEPYAIIPTRKPEE